MATGADASQHPRPFGPPSGTHYLTVMNAFWAVRLPALSTATTTIFTLNGLAFLAAFRRFFRQRLWRLPLVEPLLQGCSLTVFFLALKPSDMRDTVRLNPAMRVAPVLIAACSRNLRRQA